MSEKREHCFACYHFMRPGQPYYLSIEQAVLRADCAPVDEIIRATEDLAVEVKRDRLLVRRGKAEVEMLLSSRREEQVRHFCDLEYREAKEIVPGVRIRTFWGDEMLLSIADLDANVTMPIHGHSHEQAGTVIAGELELTIGGETRFLKPGDCFLIPGGVEHGAKTGDTPVRVLDVFSPVREDYQY